MGVESLGSRNSANSREQGTRNTGNKRKRLHNELCRREFTDP